MRGLLLAATVLAFMAGCTVGPDYKRPDAAVPGTRVPPAFKELAGWKPATPMDSINRGSWWRVFHDQTLDGLEQQVVVNNQNIAAALAAYTEAKAALDQARAAFFPTVTANPGVTRSAGGTFGTTPRTSFSAQLNADWEIDVWGKVRRQVESNVAGAQLSAATLANTTLSAQATLATAYFELRIADATQRLLDRTVDEDRRALRITQNQYGAGVAARADVITAQTQLETTQAQAINVGVARAQYEHAIAVLTGHAPADLTLAPGDAPEDVPVAPVSVPSALLERRPDIANAERMMQEENALIGVAISAYYPSISLSAAYGFTGSPLGSLFKAANQVWSLGAAGAETVFDGGLRGAQVASARAAYDQSVATYRQTVLTAFQNVEDQLSNLRILALEYTALQTAVTDARRAVEIALNEYRAGTQAYTAVITAQNTALSDEESLLSVQQQRLVASVALIQALGGGWTTADLPTRETLTRKPPFMP
jgi:NodT family efflux transporter outer membrane factor (OMF) lipoprotein